MLMRIPHSLCVLFACAPVISCSDALPGGQSGSDLQCAPGANGDAACADALGAGWACGEEGICVSETELAACADSGSPTVDVGNYPTEIVDWAEQSDLTFTGSVIALNASSFDYPFDLSKSLVVQTSAFFGNPGLTPGEVTVQVDDIAQFAVGQDVLMFTNSWVIGEGVGVVEQAHLDLAAFPSAPVAVLRVVDFVRDRALHAALVASDLIVAASVADVALLEGDGGVTEHDPLWAEAVLSQGAVLCGAEGDPRPVRFASSVDVAWYDAPKLAVGDEALFILQPDTVTGLGGDAFVVLAASSVRDIADAAAVSDLLSAAPSLDLSDL